MKLEDKKLQITFAQSHRCTVCRECSQEWNFDDVRKYQETSANLFHQSRESFLNINFTDLDSEHCKGWQSTRNRGSFVKDSRNLDISRYRRQPLIHSHKYLNQLGFTRRRHNLDSWYYPCNSQWVKTVHKSRLNARNQERQNHVQSGLKFTKQIAKCTET